MHFRFTIAVFYLFSFHALAASPVADKLKSFQNAVKNSPAAGTDSATGTTGAGRILSVQDLESAADRPDLNIEGIVVQLMTTHPSGIVQQTGQDLLDELETQRKARVAGLEADANAVLSKVPLALTLAKKPDDLDKILKMLQAINRPQAENYGYGFSSMLPNRINATFQFVTQWQDYLSATTSSNLQDAQNVLRNILNNRQIDAPTFFPRSEILARLATAEGHSTSMIEPAADPDVVLDQVTTVDKVSDALPELAHFIDPGTNEAWDWSSLAALDKARVDLKAGLPVDLNLLAAVAGHVWGGSISRIEAMELRALLPDYFGTQVSNPPQANETVSAYLDRLGDAADTDGNLALLQRVIVVKTALSDPALQDSSTGTRQFLAGLSQDAAGQYAPAVVSYENALKEPDAFLPIKIVGERLAAIKTAHPDEFDQGFTTFTTPAPVPATSPYPGAPPWMPPGQFGNPYNMPISVLPIPMTISISSPTSNAVIAAPASHKIRSKTVQAANPPAPQIKPAPSPSANVTPLPPTPSTD